MNINISPCGCDCSACDYLKKSECRGCREIKGKVWWATYIGATICPIYTCVIDEKKFTHCGMCPEIPCRLWHDLKDPNHTDEQHEAGIQDRVKALKKIEYRE